MFVKICGLSTPEAVDAALCGGADALGFVFSESPRRISPDLARELCEGLRRAVIRVAVMRHPTAAAWNEVRAAFAPDWLQTDREDFDALELGDLRGAAGVPNRRRTAGARTPVTDAVRERAQRQRRDGRLGAGGTHRPDHAHDPRRAV